MSRIWFQLATWNQRRPLRAVVLTASSSLYDLQRSTGTVTFNGINVTMPVGDPATASSGAKAKHRKKRHKHKHH